MIRLKNFAILFSVWLPAANAMYISGTPMMAQPDFGDMVPVMAGPVMGHHNTLMVPQPDLDTPDYHPYMVPMPFHPQQAPGAMMPGPAPARSPAMVQPTGRQVHHPAPPPGGSNVHYPPPLVQSPTAQAHPPPPPMAQPHVRNPPVAHHGGSALNHVAPHPPVNHAVAQHHGGTVAQQYGGPRNPTVAQPGHGATNVGVGHQSSHHTIARPRYGAANVGVAPQSSHHTIAQPTHGATQLGVRHPGAPAPHHTAAHGAVSTGTGHRGSSAARHTVAQPTHRVVGPAPYGVVGAAHHPKAVQPGPMIQTTAHHRPGHAVHPRPSPASARVVRPRGGPGTAPVGLAPRPQPRMRTTGVRVPASGLKRMPMRHGGMRMTRLGPYSRDGTYKTAHGEITKDGSDWSYDRRY